MKRNVALKIGISETSSTYRESQILQICSDSAQEPGSEFIPKLLDSFQHCGPNGLHHCFVLDILGPAVPIVLEEINETRLPKKVVTKAVGEALSGLAFLHKLGLGHGGIKIR
jgi:serine/threonine protein kinase